MNDRISCFKSKEYHGMIYQQALSSELNMLLAGVEQCVPGKTIGPVRRPGYHLHAVISGMGTVYTPEGKRSVRAGQLFLTRPEIDTHYAADIENPWYYCWVTYVGEKASEYMALAGFEPSVTVRDSMVDTREFLMITEKILERQDLSLFCDIRRLGLIYEYLSWAVESYSILSGKKGKDKSRYSLTRDDYVSVCLRYFSGNLDSATVQGAAKIIGIDRSYLTELFKEKIHMAPQEYLVSLRIDKAKELLRDTDLLVKTIAETVSYKDPLSFSRIFTKKTGMSPIVYRELNRKRQS